jgi:hypothetical protein
MGFHEDQIPSGPCAPSPRHSVVGSKTLCIEVDSMRNPEIPRTDIFFDGPRNRDAVCRQPFTTEVLNRDAPVVRGR